MKRTGQTLLGHKLLSVNGHQNSSDIDHSVKLLLTYLKAKAKPVYHNHFVMHEKKNMTRIGNET